MDKRFFLARKTPWESVLEDSMQPFTARGNFPQNSIDVTNIQPFQPISRTGPDHLKGPFPRQVFLQRLYSRSLFFDRSEIPIAS
jgi:hypothetical protein